MRVITLLLSITLNITACNPQRGQIPHPIDGGTPNIPNKPDENTSNVLQITVGSTVFNATLAQNEAVKAFRALLPLSLSMDELNGNEKYCYLSKSLPSSASRQGTIHDGDLMLFGSSTLVLFYENTNTSYSYTPLGKIDNPSGLTQAVGQGSVIIKFEIK